jgi:ethanolamine utilization protein EutN
VRIGEVIGKLTLSVCDPKLCGGRFLIVQPDNSKSLRDGGHGKDDVVVVYEQVGAGMGDRVGFSEGREAAMPFHPDPVAIDAYLACLIDDVTYG